MNADRKVDKAVRLYEIDFRRNHPKLLHKIVAYLAPPPVAIFFFRLVEVSSFYRNSQVLFVLAADFFCMAH